MVTTIQLDKRVKDKLDTLKAYNRETYNDLILRLINSSSPQKFDRESLVETIGVLSDPEAMRELARGIEDYNKGRVKTLAQVRRELN